MGGVHHFPTLFVVPCGSLGLAPCLFTLSVVKQLRFGRQSVDIALIVGVCEHFEHERFKIAGVELIAQCVKDLGVIDVQQRVAAVKPAVERLYRKLHAIRLRDLAAVEGKALDAGVQRTAVKAVFGNTAHGLGHKGANFVKLIGGGIEYHERRRRLINAVVYLKGDILRKTVFQKRTLERRFVRAREVVCDYLRRIELFNFVKAAQELTHDHVRTVILALGGLEIHGRSAGDGLLLTKIKVRLKVVVPGEVLGVYVL